MPPHAGPQAAIDVKEEFARKRPWHQNVICTWDEKNNLLILQADNDFDNNGLALMDEFSDAIAANVQNAGDGGIHLVSIMKLLG